MVAVAADSSIEAARDRSMNATPIKATHTVAAIIMRIVDASDFETSVCRRGSGKVQFFQQLSQGSRSLTQDVAVSKRSLWSCEPAALVSRAGFGERDRNRLLHEIDQNSGCSAGNNAGDKACENERAHGAFS
jgi:hypothetical protein